MKKRILAILLASMLILAIVACGDSSPSSSQAPTEKPAEKVQLTYWNQLSGGDGDVMLSMVELYNAGDNWATIEMTTFPSVEYYPKLITSMAVNEAPHLAISHITSLTEFVQDGYLYPLDDLAANVGLQWGEFTSRLADGIRFDGKHYAVPLDTHVFLMHYNTHMLGELNMLDGDGMPTYLATHGAESFLYYFRTIKPLLDADVMPIAGTSQGELPLYLWWSLYTQQGGKMLSDDGSTATLDNEQSLKALQFMVDLIEEDLWPKGQAGGGGIFNALQATAMFNGNWALPGLEANENLESFLSLPFPQIFEHRSVFGDSHTLVLPIQRTENKTEQVAAMDFANWMADHTLLWAAGGHIPSKTAVIESEEYRSLPYRSAYAQSADWVAFYPQTPHITGMKAAFTAVLASMVAGEYSAEQARDLLQEEMTRLIAQG